MKTNNNFQILIVDDEKLNIELAAAYLQEENYRLSFALNAQAAIESVLKKDIDLILLDINMPQKDGFEVCKILKSETNTKDIPVIFLTAQTDMAYVARAFEVGGVDYINKPFNGVELKARVKTHLQSMFYLNEMKHKQSKLAQLSITDPLTKLHNSLYFDSQIKSYLAQDKSFWIIYIKIENFEKINQLYGFHKANKIIRLFSKLVKDAAFANAIVAKLYGVSFGILLKDYDKKNIQNITDTLSSTFLQNQELSKSMNFSAVALRIKENAPFPIIYKILQTKMEKASDYMVNSTLFVD